MVCVVDDAFISRVRDKAEQEQSASRRKAVKMPAAPRHR
jgi:hypothetical protein